MTTELALKPGADQEVLKFYSQAQKLLEYAENRIITSADDLKLANDDLAVISKVKKAMEAKRKDYTIPLDEITYQTNSLFYGTKHPIIMCFFAQRAYSKPYQSRIFTNTERYPDSNIPN